MAGVQGWDSASYRCGRCGGKPVFTATTDAQYAALYAVHAEAHAVLDLIGPERLQAFYDDLRREVGHSPTPPPLPGE